MKKGFAVLAAIGLAVSVGGCQTTQESMMQARTSCDYSGYRPGTAAYKRCVGANYAQNRANSDAAGAAVAGAVAGAVLGAAVSAPLYRPYRYGYYAPGYWW